MSYTTTRRLGAIAIAGITALILSSATAFAAGKPTNLSWQSNWETSSISTAKFKASVNPNGAATTVKVEKEVGAGQYKLITSYEVGAGTKIVTFEGTAAGLDPFWNTLRVTAQNSYGTVSTAPKTIWITMYVYSGEEVEGGEEVEESDDSSYVVQGTWSLKFSSFNAKIECQDHSYGTFGGNYHAYLTNCAVYEEGKLICKRAPIEYTLDSTFTDKEGTFYLTLCPGEEGEIPVTFKAPFEVSIPISLYWEQYSGVELPMALNTNVDTIWGGGVASSSGTFHLTGEDIGKVMEFMLYG